MFAAQSLLEGLGAFMFVFNLVFATRVNKETLTKRHVWATGIIVFGIALVVAFGSHADTQHTFDEITHLMVGLAFLVYTVVALTAAVVLQLVSVWAEKNERPALLAYTYSASSAIFGSFSVVLSKSMAESLHTVITGEGFNAWVMALLAAWAGVVSWWIFRLNQCLTRFPALFVVPVLHAVWLCCTVTSGGLFFQEFDVLPWWRLFVFVLGIMILLVGVLLMPPENVHSQECEEVGGYCSQGTDDTEGLNPTAASPRSPAMRPGMSCAESPDIVDVCSGAWIAMESVNAPQKLGVNVFSKGARPLSPRSKHDEDLDDDSQSLL
eukprot:TRINITY_DN36164_c0_g1_i2.p1 TRINITY_DN36164_c0_g1~~TRINITY_DN36164_c0_g1_i2.p1  ORF type:complete len:323 (+),score=54.41 TRINITY_DN36164_c0_g1_i2:213-1181(+)